MTGRIGIERNNGVAWITIDNVAKHNAISIRMWGELLTSMEQALADPEVRVIVIRGQGGKAFASGADISEFPEVRELSAAERQRRYDTTATGALAALRTSPKPTIAMIEGYCFGGGVLLALACDIRYCSEGSTFCIPAVRVGLAYDVPGMSDLIDAVGVPFAREFFFTGKRISGLDAARKGLVNEALAQDNLLAQVEETARQLADSAPITIQVAKEMIRELRNPGSRADLDHCDSLILRCYESDDFREGYTAFLEKRKPVFSGH